jgi:hypothetical protein
MNPTGPFETTLALRMNTRLCPRRTRRAALSCALLFSLLTSAAAQSFEFFPGAKYDASVPTLKQVVGHEPGERITMHHETERYVNALQQAAPARVKLFKYGETWEGKSLYYLVIGSPENVARLDEIKAGLRKLADPRTTSQAEANSLTSSLPSVVWLAYSVHGNEISSTDAALLTAYHLLAAEGDAIADAARRNSLVVIDPMQNPDGRDRFVNYFRQNLGRWADADPQSAEHNEVWPSGRVNHYLFDMNRDWFAQSQPETQGRTKAYLEWFPQVFVDLHEMSGNSSYYFAPPALPYNPNLTKSQHEWLARFGRNNAKWFDKFRFDYYTRENYDSFYPGYGEGWPMFHGSIGMTYEQASVRGLVLRRTDETTLHYRDSVHHHFISSLSTVENAAQNREALLKYFYDFRKSAVDEGAKEAVKEYVITPGSDPSRAAKLAATLMKSGIEVKRADAPFTNARARDYFDGNLQQREFPAGSYVVSLSQPAKRLLKTLMDKHTPQDKEFLDEQRERNRRRQSEEFYDVTAWSLPLIYDVPCFMAEQPSSGQFTALKEPPQPTGRMRGERASLAYLIPWGTHSAAAALADLFRQEVRVHAMEKEFKLNGVKFPRGTLIVKVKDNPADLFERMQKLSAAHGVDVHSTDTSWVEEGPNFGSEAVVYLPRPRVALAYNTPTSPNSVGWARFVLEQRFGLPVTTLRAEQLRFADLSRYNVIILPDGSRGGYGQALGDVARLKDWVRAGGTLIGIAEASAWMADEKVGLLPSKLEKRDKGAKKDDKKEEGKDEKPEGKKDAAAPPPAAESRKADAKLPAGRAAVGAEARDASDIVKVEKAVEPNEENPSNTPGAIVRVRLDDRHWLTAGYGATTTALVDSNRIFTLLKLDQGTNVGVYLPEGKMLVSGFMWDDAQQQLPNKAFVLHAPLGRGGVIAFAEDPNYRAFLESMSLMFLNAVLTGPGR